MKFEVDIYHLPNGRAIILPADGRVINLCRLFFGILIQKIV